MNLRPSATALHQCLIHQIRNIHSFAWVVACSLTGASFAQTSDFFLSNAPAPSASLITPADLNSFLPVEQAFVVNSAMTRVPDNGANELSLKVRWQIAPDYYLYKRTLKVIRDDGKVLNGSFSRSIQAFDGYFGQVEIFYHHAELFIESAQLNGAEALFVEYQGCADAGLCYPTQQLRIDLTEK